VPLILVVLNHYEVVRISPSALVTYHRLLKQPYFVPSPSIPKPRK
jgi:hypothetical protein